MGKDNAPNQTNNFVDKRAEIGSIIAFDDLSDSNMALWCKAITKFRNIGTKTNFRMNRSEQSGIQPTARPTRIPIVIPKGNATAVVAAIRFVFAASIAAASLLVSCFVVERDCKCFCNHE